MSRSIKGNLRVLTGVYLLMSNWFRSHDGGKLTTTAAEGSSAPAGIDPFLSLKRGAFNAAGAEDAEEAQRLEL